MAQHLIFLSTPWTFSTPVTTFLLPSTWTAPLPDAVQAMKPLASEAEKASRVPSDYQQVRPHWWLPTAANSAWTTLPKGASCRREKTPETTLVLHLKWRWLQPKKWLFQWLCKRCLNGAGMAPEMTLVAAPKMALPMALQAVPERGWYGAWNGVGGSLKIALPMALQVVPERDWYSAWNSAGCSPKNALLMVL